MFAVESMELVRLTCNIANIRNVRLAIPGRQLFPPINRIFGVFAREFCEYSKCSGPNLVVIRVVRVVPCNLLVPDEFSEYSASSSSSFGCVLAGNRSSRHITVDLPVSELKLKRILTEIPLQDDSQ